jgi:hypothetical protein
VELPTKYLKKMKNQDNFGRNSRKKNEIENLKKIKEKKTEK